MFAVGIIVIVVYVWALFFAGPLAWWVAISIVALVAVGVVCGIVSWIGYTLLTTPSPTLEMEEIESKLEEAKK